MNATRLPLLLLLVLVLGACAERIAPLHIGAKNFTEQFILAEMMAQMAENEGIPVRRSIPYGDTFTNLEGLRRDDLDVYAEYNGTGLVLLGQPPIHDGDEAYQRVVELFEPLGLEWLGRFGFSNEYVLAMRSDRAAALDVETIGDLANLPEPPTFVIDESFLARPLDGYAALLRRYGLTAAEPLVFTEGDKASIYEALLEGEAEVAEVFSTDGQIADFGLTVLRDDLGFFPVYQPAPLVRSAVLARFPSLAVALNRLEGVLDIQTMRELNGAVELEGRDPTDVAREFLVENQLLPATGTGTRAEELLVAVGILDELSLNAGRAMRATRRGFPTRQVELVRTPSPMQRMLDGQVRLALVGAQAFFVLEGVFPTPVQRAEALGVVGYRMAHLLALQGNDNIDSITDMRRLGVGPANGASHRTARMVLAGLGLQDDIELVPGELDQQHTQLRRGELDGMFLMLTPGHVGLTEALEEGNIRLVGLPEWGMGNSLIRFPFLRQARIPAGTYQELAEPLETLSTQLVLAGPTVPADQVGDRGPAIIVGARTRPISDTAILALNEALGTAEQIDPSLPVANVLRPQRPEPPGGIDTDWASSLTNLVIILVIIYLIVLFRREQEARHKPHPEPQPRPSRASPGS